MITLARAGNQLKWTTADDSSISVFRADGSIDNGKGRYFGYGRFRTDSRGKVVEIEQVILDLGRKSVPFRRIDPVKPSTQALGELAGEYRSEELDVTYRMSVTDGRLIAGPSGQSSHWFLNRPWRIALTAHWARSHSSETRVDASSVSTSILRGRIACRSKR